MANDPDARFVSGPDMAFVKSALITAAIVARSCGDEEAKDDMLVALKMLETALAPDWTPRLWMEA